MIQITLTTPQDFLKIKETLTRIGIANVAEKRLYQSCHILQKQGNYFIVHFKEMLKLDGRDIELSDEDTERQNDIAALLSAWGMCAIVQEHTNLGRNFFKVVPFKDKDQWSLIPKYKIGNVKPK